MPTTAKFSPVKNVRYLSWEDAFDVEFEDGLCILEPHATIRRANTWSTTTGSGRLGLGGWAPFAGFEAQTPHRTAWPRAWVSTR